MVNIYRVRFILFVCVLVALANGFAFGEGTKEIQPDATNRGKLQVQPNWSQFGWYDRFGVSAPADYRLYIHISNIGEVIYYGFGDPLTERDSVRFDVKYRIKDPLGNVVVGEDSLPLSGVGYIPTFSQAVAGPSAIAGGSGYSELSYTPLMTGDYFIEFNFNHTWNNEHKQCKFKFFDVTVASPSNQPITGRLWSKSWQFACDMNGNPGYPFYGKTYVYSNDGIVTRCDFNGIDPLVFSVVCNVFGCTNTGNAVVDRRSVVGYAVIPQYKIFLNDPDSIAYPTGELGHLIPPITATPDCNGNVVFNIQVTQPGLIEIFLNINPLPGAQSEDTLIIAPVVAGVNSIVWNGTNGNGVKVAYGTQINASFTYYNGLTNLPLYDVEDNPNGFKVDLVRPLGEPLRVFWDDTLIAGTVNLTGCDYAVSSGCHPFNYGDNKTVNSWWYAIAPQSAPLVFTYLTMPGTIGAINGDGMVCPGSSGHIYYVHPDPNSTSYIWNYTGTGATITPVNDTTVSLSFLVTATSGNLTVRGTNTFCGPGPVTQYPIIVKPYALLTNSPLFKSQCNNMATNVVLTSNVPGTTFTWTCIPPATSLTGWSNNSTPTTLLNQTLINSGIRPEAITYQITPSANGCNGPLTNYVVTVYPVPTLTNSPASKSQCNNINTNVTLQSGVTGTTFTWTCVPSSANITGWSNNAIPTTTIAQTLVNTGNKTETVIYRLLPSANGCPGPITDYVVTVYPTPCLTNNPLNQQQCNNSSTNLVLTSSVLGTAFSWTCTASSPFITGYFPGAGNVINQSLHNSSNVDQTVTYTITPTANGCTGPAYNYVVTVHPEACLTNNPLNQQQCNNQATNLALTSNVSGSFFTWTCTPSSVNVTGFSPGTGTLVNHTLTNTGNTNETVVYTITPWANGCPGPSSNYTVLVHPTAALTNNPPSQSQCNATNTNIILQSNVTGAQFSWTCTPSSSYVTGYANSIGFSGFISQILHNSGYNNETVTYNLTPTAYGCPGKPATYMVTVYPVPDVFFTPTAQTICGGATSAITNNSHVWGAGFSWTATAIAGQLFGFGPGSGNVIAQTVNNASYTTGAVRYTVTPTANGCPGTPANVTLTVLPLPATTFTICNDPVTTTNSKPITLRGGIPLGGSYSGPGVAANTFFPSIAGPGNHVITYTAFNSLGCSKSATQVLSVLAATPFTCGNTLTDVRDNQSYATVQLGSQCWMADNLNYGTVINSTTAQRDNCIVEKYCTNNSQANCTTQGGFYQWDELMHYTNADASQGICPPGWHVPSETDWAVLFGNYAPINNAIAAADLKSDGSSGFDANLYGFNAFNRGWKHPGFATMFWSSTAIGQFKAWAHGMNTQDPSVSTYPGFRANAFTVRCIRD